MGLLPSGDGKIVTNDMKRAKVPNIRFANFFYFFSLASFAHVPPGSSDLLTESVGENISNDRGKIK